MDNEIEALLRATIQTKVVEAFNSTPDMVEKMIRAAFEKKVGENGESPPRGYGDKGIPWLEWLVGEEIRRAGLEAVREYVSAQKPAITQRVSDAIGKGEFGARIGEKIADIMAAEWRWSFSVERDG
jgi:hypothetical protein